ncbi:Response regulator RpfG family c-di-GMP phosphodiesterase [Azospirillaceae bacterium]
MATADDDDDFFLDDTVENNALSKVDDISCVSPWIVLVADDDPAVHAITTVALRNVRFRNRPIELLPCFSAEETLNLLKSRSDVAVIILDVVMESDDAGLQCARCIREELNNQTVRIILRTGQPGQAPEREIIDHYEINDYKSKIDLTQDKLYSSLITALRSYSDLMTIERNRRVIEANRRGLEKILNGSLALFRMQTLNLFANSVLEQITLLLEAETEGILCVQVDSLGASSSSALDDLEIRIIAGSGRYESLVGKKLPDSTWPNIVTRVNQALKHQCSQFDHDTVTLFVRTPHNRRIVVLLHPGHELDLVEQRLLEIFTINISVGIDNLKLYDEIRRSHKATALALADLAEYRDNDTGDHVTRVARLSTQIAQMLHENGCFPDILEYTFLEHIDVASMLHDVGKVGIPDNILQKPGPLSPEERVVMEAHTLKGRAILERASLRAGDNSCLAMATDIAAHHHEWFDGSGYPNKLARDQISLASRIVAVVDVYDALISVRPYKDCWSPARALGYITSRAGTQFDPEVVRALVSVLERQVIVPSKKD